MLKWCNGYWHGKWKCHAEFKFYLRLLCLCRTNTHKKYVNPHLFFIVIGKNFVRLSSLTLVEVTSFRDAQLKLWRKQWEATLLPFLKKNHGNSDIKEMLAVDSHSHLHPGKTWCLKKNKVIAKEISATKIGSGGGRNHRHAGLYNKKSLILVLEIFSCKQLCKFSFTLACAVVSYRASTWWIC